MYAIHSNNPEFINCLEENHLLPNDETYFETIEEAIKCHQNDIANYLIDNQYFDINNSFKKDLSIFGLQFYNFQYIQIELKSVFSYLCKFCYYEIIERIVNDSKCDLINQLSLHSAGEKNHFDVIEFLLTKIDCIFENAFHFANFLFQQL